MQYNLALKLIPSFMNVVCLSTLAASYYSASLIGLLMLIHRKVNKVLPSESYCSNAIKDSKNSKTKRFHYEITVTYCIS